jgi:hypothetical protein
MTYYAHSAGAQGDWEPNARHLRQVAELAGELAAAFDAKEEAAFTGLLHDYGKYASKGGSRDSNRAWITGPQGPGNASIGVRLKGQPPRSVSKAITSDLGRRRCQLSASFHPRSWRPRHPG